MEIKYKTINNNGEFSCGDIGISTEEWYSLITNPKAEQYIETLLCFLREKSHNASCSSIAKIHGESASHYIGKINGFAKWVQKTLGRFQIISTDGETSFWLIPMKRGANTKNGFEWQLRDELVDALQLLLKKNLVHAYKLALEQNGSLSAKDAYEIYKWEIAHTCKGQAPDKIVARLGQNDCNLIDMQRSKPSLLSFSKNAPKESNEILSSLLYDKGGVSQRISSFYNAVKGIWNPEWGKTIPNDERTAAAILASFNPDVYPYYKWEIYDIYCKYLGIDEKPTRQCYEHFIELMNDLYKEESKDKELIERIDTETSSYFHSDVFCGQDVVWQMQAWMKVQVDKQRKNTYWLAGYTLDDQDCRDSFYEEGCWQGVGTPSVNKEIESVKTGDILMLKSSYTKGANHKTTAIKICAIGIVMSNPVKGEKYYKVDVDWKSRTDKEFLDFDGSYRQTIHRVSDDLFINYAKEQLNMTSQSKYQLYIDLLKANCNLVLTGAPGTGKTYMAQEIAKEMGAEMRFVQFHPSYDYTDFVEGLRPQDNGNGQIGFERRDGVFKAFCREALQNIIDSEKSLESLAKELSWQDKLQQFIDDSIENGTLYKLSNGNDFSITEMKGHSITVHNEQNEKTSDVTVNADEILELLNQEVPLNIVRDIRNYFNRKFGTQPDSYAFIITKKVREMKKAATTTEVNKVELRPYVFIIDEINRGEASKVFGELFYAIDPGYRGKKDIRVQTQYQNLVPETDVFAKGFYVPENVYILATMNDIDRSVESMDFAMRRRFTWREITPDDTKDMLDCLEGQADEAREVMARINNVIASTDGLGKAYMIGPSYFLKLKDYDGNFESLWTMSLEPLLREYLRGFRKAEDILESFSDAYFGKNDTKEETIDIVDEN